MAGPIYSDHPAGGTVAEDWVTVALPYEYARRRNLDSGPVQFVDDAGGTVRPVVRRKKRGRMSWFFDIKGAWSSGAMSGRIVVAAAETITSFEPHANVAARLGTAPTVTWSPNGSSPEVLTQAQPVERVLDTYAERKWVYRFVDANDTVVVIVERSARNGDPVESWTFTPHRRKLPNNGRREVIEIDVGAGTVVLDESATSLDEVSAASSAITFDGTVDWGCQYPISFHSYYGDGSDPREAAAGHRPAALYDNWGLAPEDRIFAMAVRPGTSAAEVALKTAGAAWNAGSHSIHDSRPYTQALNAGQGGSQRFGVALSGSLWDGSAGNAVDIRDTSRMMVEDSCLRAYHWIGPLGQYYTYSDHIETRTYRRTPFSNTSSTGPGSLYEEIGGWPPNTAPSSNRTTGDGMHVDDIGAQHWLALFDESWIIEQNTHQFIERASNAERLYNGYIGPTRAWGRTCANHATTWWLFAGETLGNQLVSILDTKFRHLGQQWHGRLVSPDRPIRSVRIFQNGSLVGGRYAGMPPYEDSTCVAALAMMGHVLPEKARELWEFGLEIAHTVMAVSIPGGGGYPSYPRFIPYAVGLYDRVLQLNDPELGNLPPSDFYVVGSATYADRVDGDPTDAWSYWAGAAHLLLTYLEEALEAIDVDVTPEYVTERAQLASTMTQFGTGSGTAANESEFFRMTAFPESYADAPLELGDDPGGPITTWDPIDPVGLPDDGGGDPDTTSDPADPIGLPNGSTHTWRGRDPVNRRRNNTIDWTSRRTVGLPGRSMADVPAILIVGNSQVNGGPTGPTTRMNSSRFTPMQRMVDHALMKVVPSNPSTGAPNAAALGWYPWWNGVGTADTPYTVASATSTTVTVSPSPGWTTNEHAGRRVTVVTDLTTAGWLNHEVVVSNTANTLTVASWGGGTPANPQRFWIGTGRWADYHPAQAYLHPSELLTYSQRGGSAWDADGYGIGPDAGIIQQFWNKVFRSDPWFQIAKWVTELPTVGNWGSSGAAKLALTNELVRMASEWTTQGGGNTLVWDLAVVDLAQADVLDWEDSPENALSYQVALAQAIADIRSLTNQAALKIVLVNHDEEINQQSAYFGTVYANRVHNFLASIDSAITTISMEGARLAYDEGTAYSADENFPGYAAHEYWSRYATEVRKAYDRLTSGTLGSFDSSIPTLLVIGDEMAVGSIDEAFAAADDSLTYSSTARDDTQTIYNAQSGVREAYNLAANSNSSGTISLNAGPEFAAIADLAAAWGEVFTIKRASQLSGLAASPTVYGGTGGQGGRWDPAYVDAEHYGPLGALYDTARAAEFTGTNRQVDLRGVIVCLGTQDQRVSNGGALFAAALPGFVSTLRQDFATRTGDDTLRIVWVIPQLDHALSDADQSRAVRASLRAYALTDPRFVALDIDDLERDADNLELTARSQVTLGQRAAAALLSMV